MFLPSEAIYAELHANFPASSTSSYKARVWIVSPTTMMATLNTVRAVLKDVRMREEAGELQKTVGLMLDDVKWLDDRVENLSRHFSQTDRRTWRHRDLDESHHGRGDRIKEVDLGEQPAALPPKARKLI